MSAYLQGLELSDSFLEPPPAPDHPDHPASPSLASSETEQPTRPKPGTTEVGTAQLFASPASASESPGPSSDLRVPTTIRSAPSSSFEPDAEPERISPLLPGEIEMEAITPGGHRRRRSSLLNLSNGTTNSNRASSGQDEPKISEENMRETDALAAQGHDGAELTDEDLHDDEETGLTGKDRRRKKQKRRRNMLLDQRIVREKITPDKKKEADQSVLRNLLVNGVLIGLWYLFSLCISLYNKWMFDPKQLNFSFPLFTTAMHMLVQFALASLVLFMIPSLRPRNAPQQNQGTQLENERPLMTKMFYLTRIGPCGAATGLDIGLGNTSLKFITLTFYTMCKSSSLAFVLLFAFIFRLESPTWKLVAIIATMTAGVIMMVAGEVDFQVGGFFLVISAAFFSGFRWALTQILLLRNPATSNPFSSIFFLAPFMFLTLLAIAIPVEGFAPLWGGLGTVSSRYGVMVTVLLVLFPGTIAFLMTASEFALLRRTSVVTLSIAGIFKEAVTISAAALVFGDRMSPVNVSGLLVTLGSIAAYNWIKITKMRREAQVNAALGLQQDVDPVGGAAGASSSTSGGRHLEVEDDGEEAGLLRRSDDDDDDDDDDDSDDDDDVRLKPKPSFVSIDLAQDEAKAGRAG